MYTSLFSFSFFPFSFFLLLAFLEADEKRHTAMLCPLPAHFETLILRGERGRTEKALRAATAST